MKIIRSFVSVASLGLAVTMFALAGCAAAAGDEAEGENVSSSAEALTGVVPPQSSLPKIVYTDPACTAKLVATGPAIRNEPNPYSCPPADPYTGQQRMAGLIEDGVTMLYDLGEPGAYHCRPSIIVGGGLTCTHDPDRVIEETCSATLTYECPCGISYVTSEDGHQVAQCNRLQ